MLTDVFKVHQSALRFNNATLILSPVNMCETAELFILNLTNSFAVEHSVTPHFGKNLIRDVCVYIDIEHF